jgi:hypothetical protein
MIITQPFEAGGKIWDQYGISLVINENENGVATVLTLTPMRTENGINEFLTDPEFMPKPIIFPNIMASSDSHILLAVGKVKSAIQEYLTSKAI